MKKASTSGSKITSKLIVYEAPLPVRELPRLLKDVMPSLNDILSARPPFHMELASRLTVSAAMTVRFPVIDSLFRLRSGQQGQRKEVEHDTSEPLDDDEVDPKVRPKEYYYENIDVRNDLIVEAEAVLSSLTKSQVPFITVSVM